MRVRGRGSATEAMADRLSPKRQSALGSSFRGTERSPRRGKEGGVNVLDRLQTTLQISGGYRLSGSVDTHGAKNAALPIMAAALLAKSPVTLHRVPSITDVSVMWSLLESLGARLQSDGRGTLTIDPARVETTRAPYTLVRKLNASFDLVGVLLGRYGRAEVPLPGGCILGTRATDMHEQAFVALGCEVHNAHGYLIAESKRKRMQGAP